MMPAFTIDALLRMLADDSGVSIMEHAAGYLDRLCYARDRNGGNLGAYKVEAIAAAIEFETIGFDLGYDGNPVARYIAKKMGDGRVWCCDATHYWLAGLEAKRAELPRAAKNFLTAFAARRFPFLEQNLGEIAAKPAGGPPAVGVESESARLGEDGPAPARPERPL